MAHRPKKRLSAAVLALTLGILVLTASLVALVALGEPARADSTHSPSLAAADDFLDPTFGVGGLTSASVS